jgi:hypothetical protein
MTSPESQADLEIEVKYFPLGEGYVCAQLSTQMTGAKFNQLTNS